MTQASRVRRGTRAAKDEPEDEGRDNGGEDRGGAISELRGVASEAAVTVLAPVAKKLATRAAKMAVERGPELIEDSILPKLQDAGGKLGERFGGGDDDDDDDGGGGRAGDGTGKGRRMPIQQAVDVAAPLETVYDQFTQFEDFPKFMHRVERVEQRDPTTVVFHEKIWGVRRMWEAEIVEQEPDERIVWRTTSGTTHVGVVTFHKLSDRLTRVELNVDIQPEGAIEKIARGARFAKRAARADLKRFKAFVEMRDEETGAWRGAIEDGDVVDEEQSADDRDEEPEAYEDDEPEAYEDEDEDTDSEEDEEEEPEAYEESDDEDEEEDDEEPSRRATAKSKGNGGRAKSRSTKAKSTSAKSSPSSSRRGASGSKAKPTNGRRSSSRAKASSGKRSR